MKIKCYAKVNIALDVISKRKDGYHNLDGVNVKVSLHDILKVHFNNFNSIILTSNDDNLPLDSSNFVYKAIEKFKAYTGKEFGINVYIEKHIPYEAGLAGGSSDAACILNFLDKHFKTNLSFKVKADLIKSITSDGVFMLQDHPCRIQGIGDEIHQLNIAFNKPIFLLKRKEGNSTKDIYNSLDNFKKINISINKVVESLENNSLDYLSKNELNAMLLPACNQNTTIMSDIKLLSSLGFEVVSMTGTGSCLFAISNSIKPYKIAKKALKNQGFELYDYYKIIK